MRNRTDTLGLGFALIVLVLTGSLWGQVARSSDPCSNGFAHRSSQEAARWQLCYW